MPFKPGQIVLRRYFRGSRYTFVKPMRVVRDDESGLLLWMPAGSEFAVLTDTDGKTQHDLPLDEMRDPQLVRKVWQENGILVLMPREAAYSIWWFFNENGFLGWYVNLETPATRHDDGVDTTDLVLDVWVEPDRRWQWKDEDELASRTGRPLYFDRAEATAIRAEGQRLIDLAEAGAFPFDGTHIDFKPDPAWSPLDLPTGWDRPSPAQSGR
jgi:protein associated with RNAse G/E